MKNVSLVEFEKAKQKIAETKNPDMCMTAPHQQVEGLHEVGTLPINKPRVCKGEKGRNEASGLCEVDAEPAWSHEEVMKEEMIARRRPDGVARRGKETRRSGSKREGIKNYIPGRKNKGRNGMKRAQ
jgi:hypothetical protein